MLESREYWTVICDRCGVDAFKDGEFSAYSDPESAVMVVAEWGEWLFLDEKHYCEGCVEWDEEEDSKRPKPKVTN